MRTQAPVETDASVLPDPETREKLAILCSKSYPKKTKGFLERGSNVREIRDQIAFTRDQRFDLAPAPHILPRATHLLIQKHFPPLVKSYLRPYRSKRHSISGLLASSILPMTVDLAVIPVSAGAVKWPIFRPAAVPTSIK